MKRRYWFLFLVAIALLIPGCAGIPREGDVSAGGGASSKMDLAAGGADATSEQSDALKNIGGSYLGDNKQANTSIYGARKSSTPAWGGTLQAGIIQGAQSAKELKDSLAAAMTDDPVLLQLVKRQGLLLAQLEAAPDAAAAVPIAAQLDALIPMLEAAMTRIHESVRVASGGDLSNLRAIIVGSMSHNGNTVGADPLKSLEGEHQAYGKGFEKLPELIKAIMGDD
jgi:hypothetical protein